MQMLDNFQQLEDGAHGLLLLFGVHAVGAVAQGDVADAGQVGGCEGGGQASSSFALM